MYSMWFAAVASTVSLAPLVDGQAPASDPHARRVANPQQPAPGRSPSITGALR